MSTRDFPPDLMEQGFGASVAHWPLASLANPTDSSSAIALATNW